MPYIQSANAAPSYEKKIFETFDTDVIKNHESYDSFHSDLVDDGRTKIVCESGVLKVGANEIMGSGHYSILSCKVPFEISLNDTYHFNLGMFEVESNWFGYGVGITYLNQSESAPQDMFASPTQRRGYYVEILNHSQSLPDIQVYRFDTQGWSRIFQKLLDGASPTDLKNLSIQVTGNGMHQIVLRYMPWQLKTLGRTEDTLIFTDGTWTNKNSRIEIWAHEAQSGPTIYCDTLSIWIERNQRFGDRLVPTLPHQKQR